MNASDLFHKRGQLRFIAEMNRRGSPLTLAYGGRWQVDSAGHLSRAAVSPNTRRFMGSITLGVVPSADAMEKAKKWGVNWVPDGYAILPINAPTPNLLTLLDERAGVTYDVAQVLPASFGENIYNTVTLRDGPIFNRTVSVSADLSTSDSERVVFTNLPCRIFFESGAGSGMTQGTDYNYGATATASPFIEFPLVYNAQGKVVLLDPKSTIVRDDPAANGASGDIIAYRVSGLNLDPGGEGHHCRYMLDYMPQ